MTHTEAMKIAVRQVDPETGQKIYGYHETAVCNGELIPTGGFWSNDQRWPIYCCDGCEQKIGVRNPPMGAAVHTFK